MKRARQRLVVVVVLVALAGCGGKATTKAEPPPSCTTSFACPEGQRCDAGTCVLDTACPAAVAPQLLFFDPVGSFYGYLVIRDGSPRQADNAWLAELHARQLACDGACELASRHLHCSVFPAKSRLTAMARRWLCTSARANRDDPANVRTRLS